jgi:hypothetical protein
MAQLFHRSTNTLSKVTIFGAVFFLAGTLWVATLLDRSSYVTRAGVVVKQPVPFSHDHHVAGIGIDCRYCHTSVETSSFAGMPPTATCMGCHSQIWSQSPLLEPVRESFRTGTPITWMRVHNLPDYVYFDHSIHIAKGIGCVSCHGRVDRMPLLYQGASLKMEFCLDCHRNPEPHVRPREAIWDLGWEPTPAAAGELERERTLAAEYHVQSKINCSVCHR